MTQQLLQLILRHRQPKLVTAVQHEHYGLHIPVARQETRRLLIVHYKVAHNWQASLILFPGMLAWNETKSSLESSKNQHRIRAILRQQNTTYARGLMLQTVSNMQQYVLNIRDWIHRERYRMLIYVAHSRVLVDQWYIRVSNLSSLYQYPAPMHTRESGQLPIIRLCLTPTSTELGNKYVQATVFISTSCLL